MGWSKFSAVIVLLALCALSGVMVHAQDTAEATPPPCPAPDTNVSSLITEYTIPTANSEPYGIAAGSDGALWFGEGAGSNIGRITTDGKFTEFPFPVTHNDQHFLAVGPDGAMWFTDDFQNKIGRITTDGTITEYPIPTGVEKQDDSGAAYTTSYPRALIVGLDGALWFSEHATHKMARMAADGTIIEYTMPTANGDPLGLALGSDGAIWFTETAANQVGWISTDGVITEYPVPTDKSFPLRIAAGADGALWFAEYSGNKIGRITTDGTITEYPLPACAGPVGMTLGPDKAVWFTELDDSKIGRITADGQITEFVIPTADSQPFSIVTGSDGALWFTENGGSKIGRLQLPAKAPATALTTFSSETFGLHMSVSFGPDWHVLDDYPDLVTLEKKQEGWQLGFNIVNDAKLADPVDGHLVPFPDDFVSWLKSDPTLVTGEANEVMVGGIKGIQIDFTSTRTTTKSFLYLTSGTVWNIDHAAFGRFILLNDVNGERVFIWLVLSVDADQFTHATGLVQPILDSIVFTQ